MRGKHEISLGYFAGCGDFGQAAIRDAAHDMPGVQPAPAEKSGSVFVGDVQAGWGGLVLLALFIFGWGVL